MRQWRTLFHYLICSNIFISAIATLMSFGTSLLFDLKIDSVYFLFVFFATLSSYSLHWYFTEIKSDKYIDTEDQFRNHYTIHHRKLLFSQFLIASVTSIYLLYLQKEIIAFAIPAIIATFIYSAPKFPIKALKNLEGKALAKTFYLAAVWIYVTNVIPFLLSNTKWTVDIIIFLLANFTFLYVICLLFDYRDQHKDQIKYILIDTNRYFDKIIFTLTCIFGILIIAMIYFKGSIDIMIGLMATFIFMLVTLKKSTHTKSDYWFYFVLDGLMALPSLLSVIIHYLLNN